MPHQALAQPRYPAGLSFSLKPLPGDYTIKKAPGRAGASGSLKKMRAFDGEFAIAVAQLYLVHMLQRTLPAGFITPCLPTKTDKLPSGSQWLHEIKHDGFRII